jgi:hypothetical protein
VDKLEEEKGKNNFFKKPLRDRNYAPTEKTQSEGPFFICDGL